MSDKKKFHEFALQSILFKGRPDWYYCHLKTEKLAHVLQALCRQAGTKGKTDLEDAARRAASLSGEIVHLAAGEVDVVVVLADVFVLLGVTRMLVGREDVGRENGLLLVEELEQVAERLVRGSHPSPFISAEDLSIPVGSESFAPQLRSARPLEEMPAKKDENFKGHYKRQSDRMSLILDIVRKGKSLSIKQISALIKDCSEKTIQRELQALISKGLVRRVGERRWSVYEPL